MDAVVIATDYKEFKEINWDDFGGNMRNIVLLDGWQIVESQTIKAGFKFYRIGVSSKSPAFSSEE